MRLPRTLSGYLLREVLQYALLGLLAVGALLVFQNALRQLQHLAGMGLTLEDALRLLAILGARFSTYALPIAFLFGVMVALGRLSADNEVLALRALGLSLAQLLTPVLLLALVVGAGTAWLLHEAEPAARRNLRALLGEVAARGEIIRAGRFNPLDREGQRLLYVDARHEKQLEGVLVFDRSARERPYLVAAASGEFAFDPEALRGHLRLRQGDIHFETRASEDARTQRISFEHFDYSFDMKRLIGIEALRPREMSTRQLVQELARFEAGATAFAAPQQAGRERYALHLQRRLALPFAPLLFALVGVPLGVLRRRGARAFGVMVCVALVFSYYALLSGASAIAEGGLLPAWLALWIPNALLALCAAGLLRRAGRAGGGGG